MAGAQSQLLIRSVAAALVILAICEYSNLAHEGTQALNSHKISDAVQAAILNSTESDIVSVEIEVSGGITADELLEELDGIEGGLEQRRLYALKRLREIAAIAQSGLLTRLNQLATLRRAFDIKGHWLTNSVSVNIVPSELGAIVGRADVNYIFQAPEFEAIEPERPDEKTVLKGVILQGIEENLRFIGADSAWAQGFTGEGRIVCHFDVNGIDGSHPAIAAGWKGHDGDSSAAWSPGGFPRAGRNPHGTHIMGIIVGHDDLTGDTIGVAPGARWIGGGMPDFEWAADPDNNPNTTADMPDVINISMMTNSRCIDRWWHEIDMVEALDIVVIIAAGNEGSARGTVGSPGSRAKDSLTNFAVGSVDHRTSNIWWSSSRGPSPCDGVSIKPNICAPGVSIRSAGLAGNYEVLGGTSMAAPHVAGAVAILRQCAPDATTREIKEALLAGATPRGSPYPNNDYGWGILSIPKALAHLGSRNKSDLKIAIFDSQQVPIGNMLTARIGILNRGKVVDSVYAVFDRSNGIRIMHDSIFFGKIGPADTVFGDRMFSCTFEDTLLPGKKVPVRIRFMGSGGYCDSAAILVQVGIDGEKSFFTHNNDSLLFTISNLGDFRGGKLSSGGGGTAGFQYGPEAEYLLNYFSLVLAIDSSQVSDCLPTRYSGYDADFWNSSDDSLMSLTPGSICSQETRSVFYDSRAENPIGLRVQQRTFTYRTPKLENSVILEYQITNMTSAPIANIFVGLVFDWNTIHFLCCKSGELGFWPEGLGYLRGTRHSTGEPGYYIGLEVLSYQGIHSYHVLPHNQYPTALLSESAKYNIVSDGALDSTANDYKQFAFQTISAKPLTLMPDETDTVCFGLIGAFTLQQLFESASIVKNIWRMQSPFPPPHYGASRTYNFPNPFNCHTVISYSVRVESHTTVEIFNILGQKVRTLVDESQPAGDYQTVWDGLNHSRQEVASGIYFYRIKSGKSHETRKMILLK